MYIDVSVYVHLCIYSDMCIYISMHRCVFTQDSQVNGSEMQPGKSWVFPQPSHPSGPPEWAASEWAAASCQNSEPLSPWLTALVRIT